MAIKINVGDTVEFTWTQGTGKHRKKIPMKGEVVDIKDRFGGQYIIKNTNTDELITAMNVKKLN